MARTNYPNMSYCMMENTQRALKQVLEDMQDRADDVASYTDSLQGSERRSFLQIYELCKQIVEIVDADGEVPEEE